MATYSKTVQTALLALQSVASQSVAAGSASDVSGKLGGLAHARFGRRSASAAGASVNIRLESSSKTSGDNSWFPFAQFSSNFAATASQAVSGTVNSGTNVITVASTTNLPVGTVVFIDNGTMANGEFGRVKSLVTNTSITIEDNLVNAQTSSTIYTGAEIYSPVSIPPEAVRVRAVADGSLFTQAFAVEVNLLTVDGLS